MKKHPQKSGAYGRPEDTFDQNQEAILNWLIEFRGSENYKSLDETRKGEVEFVAGVICTYSKCLLKDLGAVDIEELMLRHLPHWIVAKNPEALIDACVEFLLWAVHYNRILDRSIEKTCRKIRGESKAAMSNEHLWAPSKQLAMGAISNKVDISDSDAVREFWLAQGYDARYVDEFLPPPPVSLGFSRWLYFDHWKQQ